MGHTCDCADYSGKALVPCTETNPCGGCYTVIDGTGRTGASRGESEQRKTQNKLQQLWAFFLITQAVPTKPSSCGVQGCRTDPAVLPGE